MAYEMNEFEKRALEEIKNGKTEFLFEKGNSRKESKDEIEAPFFLKSFGFIEYEIYSDNNSIGYINVALTEKGRYHFMDEKEIREDIEKNFKGLFE